MRIADYQELRVYKLAFDSAMEIFALSKRFPSEEKFALTDQNRRSSRSVCANIAEAWRKRRYEAAFVSKLSDSDAEAAETEVHLDFALHCGYMDSQTHAKLGDHYDHICRQLANIMDDAPSWCGNGCELRELPAEYFADRKSVKAAGRSSTPHASDAPRSTRS